MPSRPEITVPDPHESIIGSSLPTFKYVRNQAGEPWLPNISEVLNVEEADYSADVDELPPEGFECYPIISDDCEKFQLITEHAEKIAAWVFNTYSLLVYNRLKIYNKWRKRINAGPNEGEQKKYRRACRLATEQILRRDLPQSIFPFNYDYTILPIFEIAIALNVDPGTHPDCVLGMEISATVEVRLRHVIVQGKFKMSMFDQDRWSSSSSSFSSDSSYFPN